jgi:tight adherence protein C
VGHVIPLVGMLSVWSACAAWWLRTDRAVGRRVTWLTGQEPAPRPSVPRFLAAVGRSGVVVSLGARAAHQLKERVDSAGGRASVDMVVGTKVVLAGMSGSLLLWASGGRPSGLAVATVAGVAAYRLPDFWLARIGRRRRAQMDLRVPDLVELLVATTEAGLAPPVALRRSAEALRGPLADELRRAVAEIELGLPWRDAMDRMVERTHVDALRRLAGALARSNRLGASVRAALRSVSEELRAERRARAEEMARRAPVKMLFPLVFLILPAFLLLTVGPVVLATVHSLRSG